jgi:hypothetical protein
MWAGTFLLYITFANGIEIVLQNIREDMPVYVVRLETCVIGEER